MVVRHEEAVVKNRIDFLLAGVQKCGTGSLHDLLNQHPAISMSLMKEPHFFDKRGFESSESSYQSYHQQAWGIDGNELEESVLYGESTPKYTLHNTSGKPLYMERIVEYNPSVKLIVLFRDPVDRAYSHWNMLRSEGRDIPSFDELVRERLLDPPLPWKHFDVFTRGEYGRVLFNLLSNFPSDNLCLLKTKDLNDQMPIVESFLGIDPHIYHSRYTHVAEYSSLIDPGTAERLREFYTRDAEIFSRLSGIEWVY